jgi:hypothetical protein
MKTLSIKNKYLKAKYYYDGSGELSVINGLKYHQPLIDTESGTLITHIKDVQDKIYEYKLSLEILKMSLKALKKNVKNLKSLEKIK